jgi:ribonuclease G
MVHCSQCAKRQSIGILVQVVKEPISTKGPRISSSFPLPDDYIVLVPFSDRVSVSQKIEEKGEKDD